MTRAPIAIYGAGAFGTALAVALAQAGAPVTLVARTKRHADRIAQARQNTDRLPGVALPPNVTPTAAPEPAAEVCLIAVPTQTLSRYLEPLAPFLTQRKVVACCKGVDVASGLGPTGIIDSKVPSADSAILSGPSFAVDIAAGLPTALTVAAASDTLARQLQHVLATPVLRLYRTTDVVGVEYGGALKNVIAIAAGVTVGAGLGESARAALMTRGYAEIVRFAVARGARPETLAGLSGLGDLVLTCTSEKSRNFSYGLALGKGGELPRGMTVEGVETAKAVSDIGKQKGIDLPITTTVAALVAGRISVPEAVQTLLARPLKKE